MCTIAALTSFPEPWIHRDGEQRLSLQHRQYSGARCSDHVALLCAYQEWNQLQTDYERRRLCNVCCWLCLFFVNNVC
jgi:hypothetical protein